MTKNGFSAVPFPPSNSNEVRLKIAGAPFHCSCSEVSIASVFAFSISFSCFMFLSATVTYKATGENYFTEQTKLSPANKTSTKIIKRDKKILVVKYTKMQTQKERIRGRKEEKVRREESRRRKEEKGSGRKAREAFRGQRGEKTP